MKMVISQKFFDRPTLTVARDLLGKYLVRRYRGKMIAVMITEVEAYDGPHDRASHAYRGRTPRNVHMFGPAGIFYVYFTYGMHWLLNIVTGPDNYPAAVLIRAGMYRDPKTGCARAIRGPARLTKFLHVDKAQNGKSASKKTDLWFEDRGTKTPRSKIYAGRRVGVQYAGEIWAWKPYNLKFFPMVDRKEIS
jgi:DNA-3-methyladenine glycosylase